MFALALIKSNLFPFKLQSRYRRTKSANYHSFFLRDSDNLIWLLLLPILLSFFFLCRLCVCICLSLIFRSSRFKSDPKGEIKLLSLRNNQIYNKKSLFARSLTSHTTEKFPFNVESEASEEREKKKQMKSFCRSCWIMKESF